MGEYFNVQYLQNNDEKKFLLPFLRISPKRTCTEVTLGVGYDIAAEQKLLKLYPQCELFGADPSKGSGKPFENVGQYFEIAISNATGNITNLLNLGGGYYPKIVPTVTLVDFLTSYVNRSFIDFLWIDNEGPEYALVPQFIRNGPIDEAGITICQMNVEFHKDKAQTDGFTWFAQFMEKVIPNSQMIPLMSVNEYGNNRVLFVNAENPTCLGIFNGTRDFKKSSHSLIISLIIAT